MIVRRTRRTETEVTETRRTMSDKAEELSLSKVILFDGTKKNWPMWKVKFMTRANRKGYKQLLTGDTDIPDKGTVDNDELKLLKKADLAYEDMVMAIDGTKTQGKVVFNILHGSTSTNKPDGDCAVAWKRLNEKFEPKTAPNRLLLSKQYQNASLRAGADPSAFITYMEELKVKLDEMGYNIPETQFIDQVLNNLTEEYELEVKILEGKTGVTIDEVRDELILRYEKMKSKRGSGYSNNSGDESKEETALAAVGGKQFKGKCYKCGKIGHKGADCRSGKNNSGNNNNRSGMSFTGECFYCKKKGHRIADCRKKKADEGGSSGETEQAEVAFMGFEEEMVVEEIDESFFNQWDESCMKISQEFRDDEFVPFFGPEEVLQDMVGTFNWPEELQTAYDTVTCEDTTGVFEDEMSCETCLAYEPPAPTDEQWIRRSNTSDAENEVAMPLIGQCPHCNGYGQEGLPCTECEDLAQVYQADSDAVYEPTSEEGEGKESTGSEERDAAKQDFREFLYDMGEHLYGLIPEDAGRWSSRIAKKLKKLDIETTRAFIINIFEVDAESTIPRSVLKPLVGEALAWLESDIRGEYVNQGEHALPMAEMGKSYVSQFTANTWLADSGASSHMGFDDSGMTDVKHIETAIKIGNGKSLMATKKGRKHLTIKQMDGTEMDVVLEDYKVVPDLWVNLFSVTKALRTGWNLGNKGVHIHLSKGDKRLTFDKTMKTSEGVVVGIDMVPRTPDGVACPALLRKGKTVDINILHKVLGHPGETILRKSAEYYDLKLTGKLQPCEDCALAKSRQRNVQQVTDRTSTTKGERLFIDTTSVKSRSIGGSKFWLAVLDDATDYVWSYFLKHKDDQVSKVVELIKDLREKGTKVAYIRCDNAGENKSLEKACRQEGMGITFEYTSPNSPQFNGRIERKLATMFNKVRASLNGAKLNKRLRSILWAECAAYVTLQENLCVRAKEGRAQCSPHKAFYNEDPGGWELLRPFGEIGVVNYGSTLKIQAKLDNKGRACMHIGKATNCPDDTYRFLNLDTNRVINSRDVAWSRKMYGEYKELSETEMAVDQDDDDPDAEEARDEVNNNDADDDYFDDDDDYDDGNEGAMAEANEEAPHNADAAGNEVNPRVQRAINRLQWNVGAADELNLPRTRSGNVPDVATAVTEALQRPYPANPMDTTWVEFCFHSVEQEPKPPSSVRPEQYKDVFEAPSKFQDAWNHTDPFQRQQWRDAIKKEFDKMKNLGVWKKIKRSKMPKGRRCVKHKWVLEIKRNGVFRARLVACGYSQVPGIDFQEVYSPVVNDITIRILLIMMMVQGYDSILVDVETAFLHGELKDGEEIYMDCPAGMIHHEDECLLLQKTIYGLVQSARAYFNKAKEVLKKAGFIQSKADPCLFVKHTESGETVYLAMWVDDCLCVGPKKEIYAAIEEIKRHFKVKVEESISDYLSCEIVMEADRKSAWMGQPHLIRKIRKVFGDLVKGVQRHDTPGTPHATIVRPEKDDETDLSDEEQSLYRSGTGMLLYLTKYTRPDICNAVRELTKCMQRANRAAYKEMLRLVNFVLNTKDLGLRLEPTVGKSSDEWDLLIYTDSDWAGDKETRRSITGFIIFLMGCAILWRSKQQKSVSLSSAEAEYYALSEAAKEIKFVAQLLMSMGMRVKIPIIVRVDNVGAIFMSENLSTNSKSKHIDIRARFVAEMIEDGFIKVVFVKSNDNLADGFTKNVSGDTFKKHQTSIVSRKPD